MDENGVHHHEWGDWEITIDGTYQQEGVKERVCTKCGEKETAKISRQVCLHKWGWVITQAQLLKEGGTKRHYTWTGFLDMIDHRHPVVRPKAFYVYSWCLVPRSVAAEKKQSIFFQRIKPVLQSHNCRQSINTFTLVGPAYGQYDLKMQFPL